MLRRNFLKLSIAGSLVAGAGSISIWMIDKSPASEVTIDSALRKLDILSKNKIRSFGEWQPAQIFLHIAQSIEYSISGYPQHKSDIFKSTLGQAAFSVFSNKRKMSHGLNEFIPGSPPLNQYINIESAIEKLQLSLLNFEQYSGKLEPHFAYGKLTKAEYTVAHVMHLNNHLEEITIV